MSNVIQHSRGNSSSKKSNGALVIIISLVALVFVLFSLNYFLNKSTKKNTAVIEKVADNRQTMGDPNAKIKLVEYADFQCPACARFSAVFPEVFKYINDKYGSSTLSLTYKYFPLVSIHQNALLSAYSAEAAKQQGKFWEMHDILFSKQNDWGEALDAKIKIEGYAKDMGLDMTKFVVDRDSQSVKDSVSAGLKESTQLQLDHTPTIFINGIEWSDISLTALAMEKALEEKLNSTSPEKVTENSNIDSNEARYVQSVTKK